MQTKTKNSRGTAGREYASPRVSRAQQKVSENVEAVEKKVKDLITSSARKQRHGKLLPSTCLCDKFEYFTHICLYRNLTIIPEF
jgi:uncharacterized Fe-S cluster-containing MiaB family protein